MDGELVMMVILGLVIYIALCIWIGTLAKDKGRDAFAWTALSLVVSPLFALIALLVVGDEEQKSVRNAAENALREQTMRKVLDEGFHGTPEQLVDEVNIRTAAQKPAMPKEPDASGPPVDPGGCAPRFVGFIVIGLFLLLLVTALWEFFD